MAGSDIKLNNPRNLDHEFIEISQNKNLSDTSEELLNVTQNIPRAEQFISQELSKLKEETQRLYNELERYKLAFNKSKGRIETLKEEKNNAEELRHNDKQKW